MIKILHFAKTPPPIGGVTIHVQRLHNGLLDKGITSDIFDYSKDRNLTKIFKANIIHIHLSHKLYRLILVVLLKLIRKKVVVTFHGKYDFDNIKDKLTLRLCNSAIVLNDYSFYAATKLKKTKLYKLGAFIPPGREIVSLNSKLYDLILNFKTEYKLTFCTNASSFVLDSNNKEIYMGTELINFFTKYPNLGLLFSDPSKTYSSFFEKNNIILPDNVIIINSNHDFVNVIKESDAVIRATTMDGDSLSVKEALFFKKNVFCTDIVDRPEGVILFRDLSELHAKIEKYTYKEVQSDVVSSLEEILNVYNEM